MSKKSSSVSAIDHFFHQRKDTFQIIGRYGLFLMCIAWFLFCVLLLIKVPPMISLMIEKGVRAFDSGVFVGNSIWSKISVLFQPLAYSIMIGVAAVILSRLFRRYAKGDVFSMQNKGLLVALGTMLFICSGAPILGTLLLAVAVVCPAAA